MNVGLRPLCYTLEGMASVLMYFLLWFCSRPIHSCDRCLPLTTPLLSALVECASSRDPNGIHARSGLPDMYLDVSLRGCALPVCGQAYAPSDMGSLLESHERSQLGQRGPSRLVARGA